MPDATPQVNVLPPVDSKDVLFKFDGAEMSSDAGLILFRNIEQKLGLPGIFTSCLNDPRDPAKTIHSLEEIMRFRTLMIVAGYEDGNNANKLRHYPCFRLALERAPETGTALYSQPTISRMENLADTRSLIKMWHESIRVYCESFNRPPKQIVLDIDDTFDTIHGEQQLCLFNTATANTASNP